MNFTSPFSLGVYIGAVLDGVSPAAVPFMEGVAKAASVKDQDAANRLVLQQVAGLMEHSKYARGAPACHFKLASQNTAPEARAHRQELVNLVTLTMRALAPQYEKAATTAALISMLEAAGKGTVAATAGVGALGGAALWKIQDQLKKDDLKVKSREAAADYYRSLTGNLNQKMRDKYDYSNQEGPPKDFVSRRRSKEMEQLMNRTKYRWDAAQTPALMES